MDGNDVSSETLIAHLKDTDEAVQRSAEWVKKYPNAYSIKTMHNSVVKRQNVLQSECIRLGYGERDSDGNFVLKEER